MLNILNRGRLKAQDIHKLCQPSKFFGLVKQQPMLVPYSSEKVRVNGKSKGLSAASYDVSIDHDLVLGPNPSYLCRDVLLARHDFERWSMLPGRMEASERYNVAINALRDAPKCYSLAYTVEDFFMPHNVTADVADKSTYARLFVSCYNTFIDPGFCGNLQLEIVNDSAETVVVKQGDPICQIIFSYTNGKTDRPYDGKYQHQKRGIVTARLEADDGSGYTEKHV